MAKATTIVLSIIALVALIGLVMVFKGNSTGAIAGSTYQQPGYRLPLHEYTSVFIPDFDICQQYSCFYDFGESEPAFTVGIEDLTGNTRCGCYDGRTFIVRSDWIGENFYE